MRVPVKNDDLNSLSLLGFEKISKREAAHIMFLKTQTPIRVPIIEEAAASRHPTQVSLFVAVFSAHGVAVFQEIIENFRMRADLEAENRGIADVFAGQIPVFDDAELAGNFEKRVERVENHHVEVEKKRGSFDVGEFFLKKRQLAPTALGAAVESAHFRQGADFDVAAQTGRGVGETNEAVRARQMPLHARRKDINVFGGEFGSPFHAKNVIHRATFHRYWRKVEETPTIIANFTTAGKRNL